MKKTVALLAAVLSVAACSDQAQTPLEQPVLGEIGTFTLSSDLLTTRLAWSGSSASAFDIYRNDALHAVVGGDAGTTGYVDVQPAPGSYTYRVCEAGARVCTSPRSVTTR